MKETTTAQMAEDEVRAEDASTDTFRADAKLVAARSVEVPSGRVSFGVPVLPQPGPPAYEPPGIQFRPYRPAPVAVPLKGSAVVVIDPDKLNPLWPKFLPKPGFLPEDKQEVKVKKAEYNEVDTGMSGQPPSIKTELASLNLKFWEDLLTGDPEDLAIFYENLIQSGPLSFKAEAWATRRDVASANLRYWQKLLASNADNFGLFMRFQLADVESGGAILDKADKAAVGVKQDMKMAMQLMVAQKAVSNVEAVQKTLADLKAAVETNGFEAERAKEILVEKQITYGNLMAGDGMTGRQETFGVRPGFKGDDADGPTPDWLGLGMSSKRAETAITELNYAELRASQVDQRRIDLETQVQANTLKLQSAVEETKVLLSRANKLVFTTPSSDFEGLNFGAGKGAGQILPDLSPSLMNDLTLSSL